MLVFLYPVSCTFNKMLFPSLSPLFFFFFKGKVCVKVIGIFLMEKGKRILTWLKLITRNFQKSQQKWQAANI